MSPIQPVSNSNQPPPVAPVSASTTNTNAQIAAATNAGTSDSKTNFGTMNQLKEKSPKLYNMMLQGIATNMVNELKDHQTRIKEMMREARSRDK
jgi:hypothetical protein